MKHTGLLSTDGMLLLRGIGRVWSAVSIGFALLFMIVEGFFRICLTPRQGKW